MTHEELYESKSQMKRVEILKAAEKQTTYDELLAVINEHIQGRCASRCLEHMPWRSLRAALELHKPTEPTPGYPYGPYCTHEVGYEWPCPTIQAIEKELS